MSRASARRPDTAPPAEPRKRIPLASRLDVVNKDPKRRYFWVNPNDDLQGIEFWEALGAEVVVANDDPAAPKLRSRRGVAPGADLTCMGQVLMSMSNEDWQELYETGPDGQTGQAYFDGISRQMRPKGPNGQRYFRGVTPQQIGGVDIVPA